MTTKQERPTLPEGFRIVELDGVFFPEKWDAHRHWWKGFDKGQNTSFWHKTWNGAHRFILRKVAEKQAREQESDKWNEQCKAAQAFGETSMALGRAVTEPKPETVESILEYLSSQLQQHEEGSIAGGVFYRITSLYGIADTLEDFAVLLQESIQKLSNGYLLDPQLRQKAITLYQQVIDKVGKVTWKALQATPSYCEGQAAKFVAEPEVVSLAAYGVA